MDIYSNRKSAAQEISLAPPRLNVMCRVNEISLTADSNERQVALFC